MPDPEPPLPHPPLSSPAAPDPSAPAPQGPDPLVVDHVVISWRHGVKHIQSYGAGHVVAGCEQIFELDEPRPGETLVLRFRQPPDAQPE